MNAEIETLASLFPAHKASLHLDHNDHLSYYQTAAQWIADHRSGDWTWASDEQRQKAIDTNEVWTLQWYPRTPIGSICIAAADLDALLEFAKTCE